MAEIIGERISERMRQCGLSQSVLAQKVGISQPSIGRLISGETRESSKIIELSRALETTPEYLIGETEDPSKNVKVIMAPAVQSEDDVEIQEVDLAFGMGATFLDELPVKPVRRKFSRSWLRQFTHSPLSEVYCAHGMGDSMMPTILDSDVLLIDTAQRTVVTSERIWAISYCGLGSIKRLRPSKDGGIKIMSDNPSVSDETAYDSEMHILGRVVAVVRKL